MYEESFVYLTCSAVIRSDTRGVEIKEIKAVTAAAAGAELEQEDEEGGVEKRNAKEEVVLLEEGRWV